MPSSPAVMTAPALLRVPPWASLVATALGAVALAWVGFSLSRGPGSFSLFWPLSGLTLGMLLVSPQRRWPGLVAAATIPVAVLNTLAGEPAGRVATFAAAGVLEAPLGAWLALRLCRGTPDLSRLGDVSRLVLAGPVLASGVSCLIPAGLLWWSSGAPFGLAFVSIWSGAMLGTLAVAPALLAWCAGSPAPRPGALRLAEAAGLAAATAAVAWVLYGPAKQIRPPAVMFLPVLLWAAFRFGMRGTTVTTAVVSALVLWFTVHGMGRFAEWVAPLAGMISAQMYCAINLLSMLAMTSVFESRRMGAEALRRSQRQLRLVRFATDAVMDPLACLDPAGTFVYVNDALCKAAHRRRDAILGQPAWSLLPALDATAWSALWAKLREYGPLTAELTAAIEGRPVPFEVHSSYLCFDGQEFCVSVARDLRDRRQAEAALRLASIGTMAAGMAHEINNPLASLLANVEWISENLHRAHAAGQVSPETPAGAALRAIEPALAETAESAARIRDVVRDLKLFSRSAGDDERPRPADVVRALRGAVTLAQHEIRHRARLVQDYQDVRPVQGDEHRLGQVFLNLILNAAQAIPEGHLSDNRVRVAARRGGEGEVLVEVEDTGCGMAPEVLARIFDPFFTTKPVGFGTGLGLSICHGIVAAAGGRIEVSSRPGQGTLFCVRLPVSRELTASPEEAAPAPAAAGRRCRILVVDDDPAIGRVLGRVLPEHDVQGCSSAAEALRRAAAEPFDVILCDLMMPEMTGMEFHERLARAAPGLAARTIFVTGGPFTPAASAFLERTANPHLPKPFDTAALRAEIERVMRELGAPQASGLRHQASGKA